MSRECTGLILGLTNIEVANIILAQRLCSATLFHRLNLFHLCHQLRKVGVLRPVFFLLTVNVWARVSIQGKYEIAKFLPNIVLIEIAPFLQQTHMFKEIKDIGHFIWRFIWIETQQIFVFCIEAFDGQRFSEINHRMLIELLYHLNQMLNLGFFARLLNLSVCINKRPSTSGKEKKSRDSRHC